MYHELVTDSVPLAVGARDMLAARRANLEPARCVAVEDAPVGIAAALAAGMPAIGLVDTHPAERLRAAGVACIVERLADLTPDMVLRLLTGA